VYIAKKYTDVKATRSKVQNSGANWFEKSETLSTVCGRYQHLWAARFCQFLGLVLLQISPVPTLNMYAQFIHSLPKTQYQMPTAIFINTNTREASDKLAVRKFTVKLTVW